MKFQINKNNITYINLNFKEWFGDMTFTKSKKFTPLISKKLHRNMNDKEILGELKPEKVSLADVSDTIQTLDRAVWALFYVKDVNGVLRTVRVFWRGDGWHVFANSVGDIRAWYAGYRVFSRNFLDAVKDSTLTPCLPDTLEINGITYVKK